MKILSLDTSTNYFALAVSDKDQLLFAKEILAERVLENSIIPLIDGALKEAKIPLKEIEVIAIGLGPGSFTSLRVGLATVKAFAFAQQKKVIGIPSLDIIVQSVIGQKVDEVAVITDARRESVYHCLYAPDGRRKSEYGLSLLNEFLMTVSGKTLFVGDALKLYQSSIMNTYKTSQTKCEAIFAGSEFQRPLAKHLATLAWQKAQAQQFVDSKTLVPLYLYPAACQVNIK